ncbi:hypothetical protein K0M31_016729 [Melipona bicolor]|uniref:Uncharacterized protein n=1 Tax=Melipona bicolor TaxID=60889 RepID=A0AA40FF20_9HYME|nr:hypothetical protein K0M31_016729 [Melipona bicolor]
MYTGQCRRQSWRENLCRRIPSYVHSYNSRIVVIERENSIEGEVTVSRGEDGLLQLQMGQSHYSLSRETLALCKKDSSEEEKGLQASRSITTQWRIVKSLTCDLKDSSELLQFCVMIDIKSKEIINEDNHGGRKPEAMNSNREETGRHTLISRSN